MDQLLNLTGELVEIPRRLRNFYQTSLLKRVLNNYIEEVVVSKGTDICELSPFCFVNLKIFRHCVTLGIVPGFTRSAKIRLFKKG